MDLIHYLKDSLSWPDELIEAVDIASSRKMFLKKQVILPVDNYSRSVYFIEQGMVRMFYKKSDKDITHYFFNEGTFAAGSESTFRLRKSIYGIQAVENATVAIIPYPLIEELAKHSILVNQLIQSILLESLMGFSSRLHSLQFETGQERYQNLINQHPDILRRAPLGDIASYLGISQQTLSVIRAQR